MIHQAGATRNNPDKEESRDASRASALFCKDNTMQPLYHNESYLGWSVSRGVNCNEAPKMLSSSESDVTHAIRKYL